jgi:hypothetical protein
MDAGRIGEARSMTANRRNHLQVFAGWSVCASGVVAICGLVPFVTYPFRINFPGLNDNAALVQYLLALPIAFALYPLARPCVATGSLVATLTGIGGILLFTVVQAILVFSSMQWAVYFVLIAAATLMIGAWVVITGVYLRRSSGPLRRSLAMSILGATYFAYPIWAIWLGRLLIAGKLTTIPDPVGSDAAVRVPDAAVHGQSGSGPGAPPGAISGEGVRGPSG